MDEEENQPVAAKNVGGRPRRGDNPSGYAVYLPTEAAEWAKTQPEGLSGLLSQLLTEAMQKRQKTRKEK